MFGVSPVKNSLLNEGSAYGDFYNAIDNFFNDDFFNRPSLLAKGFRMDVKETSEAYVIEAELPGVKKDEIEISYNKDNLYIGTHYKGEKAAKENEVKEGMQASSAEQENASNVNNEAQEGKTESQQEAAEPAQEKVRYLHKERRRISMQRAIYLPDIKKEAIEAKLDSGILTVIVPKLSGKESEVQIQIQ